MDVFLAKFSIGEKEERTRKRDPNQPVERFIYGSLDLAEDSNLSKSHKNGYLSLQVNFQKRCCGGIQSPSFFRRLTAAFPQRQCCFPGNPRPV